MIAPSPWGEGGVREDVRQTIQRRRRGIFVARETRLPKAPFRSGVFPDDVAVGRRGKSGGEPAAVQTLRAIRGCLAVAPASGVRLLQHRLGMGEFNAKAQRRQGAGKERGLQPASTPG